MRPAFANVSADKTSQDVQVELSLHDGMLRGRVSASGSGLAPDDRTSNGIDLLVARKRAELVGGRFLVDATRGRGTDVYFELPIPSVELEAVS